MKRIICWLRGHREGAGLYKYHYMAPPELRQTPGRTYAMVPVGFECSRCGKRVIRFP